MMLNRVDLPQPDGPITPRNSPGATLSETRSTAVSTPSGVSNRLTMSSTTRMADAAFGALASMRSDGAVTADMPSSPLRASAWKDRAFAGPPPYSTSSPPAAGRAPARLRRRLAHSHGRDKPRVPDAVQHERAETARSRAPQTWL